MFDESQEEFMSGHWDRFDRWRIAKPSRKEERQQEAMWREYRELFSHILKRNKKFPIQKRADKAQRANLGSEF